MTINANPLTAGVGLFAWSIILQATGGEQVPLVELSGLGLYLDLLIAGLAGGFVLASVLSKTHNFSLGRWIITAVQGALLGNYLAHFGGEIIGIEGAPLGVVAFLIGLLGESVVDYIQNRFGTLKASA